MLFPWTFSRSFYRAIFRGAIFPGTLSQWRYRSAHTQELFLCASSQWLFRHALSQKFLQRVFLQGFFSRPLSGSFFRTLLCRDFPVGFSQGHLLCTLSHGRFPIIVQRVVFSALCRRIFFSAIFSGLSPCAFLLGRFLWAPSRGLFRYTLSCGAFILHFSATEISISSVVGAISER